MPFNIKHAQATEMPGKGKMGAIVKLYKVNQT